MEKHKEEKPKLSFSVNVTTVLTTIVIGILMFLGSSFMQSWQSKQTEADIKKHEDRLNNQDVLNATIALELKYIHDGITEINNKLK